MEQASIGRPIYSITDLMGEKPRRVIGLSILMDLVVINVYQ
jgi:hypothetical protein